MNVKWWKKIEIQRDADPEHFRYRRTAGLIPWLSLSKHWQYGWIIQHMVWMSARALCVWVYHDTHLWAYLKCVCARIITFWFVFPDPARGEAVLREGHEQHASPIRRGGQSDEGEPGPSSGGSRQEKQSDPGERSQQRREGQEPHAGCELLLLFMVNPKS